MDEPLLICQNELIPLCEDEREQTMEQEPQPQIYINRVQRLCDAQHKLECKKQTLRMEIDLSMILIREMKNDKKVIKVMIISTLIDILIRANYYIYLILVLLNHYEQESTLIFIIYLMTVPRILLLFSLIKLLVHSLHKFKNQSIMTIIVLFRQNFTTIDMNEESQKEWYDWRYENYAYARWPLAIYLMLPNEISYLQLCRSEQGLRTYIVSSFILKTIEIVTFVPVFLVLLYLNKFLLENQSQIRASYNEFTLVMAYVDICKYIFLSVFYLTKRNYQINKK